MDVDTEKYISLPLKKKVANPVKKISPGTSKCKRVKPEIGVGWVSRVEGGAGR